MQRSREWLAGALHASLELEPAGGSLDAIVILQQIKQYRELLLAVQPEPAPSWELVAQLAGTLKAWQAAMVKHGDWDDGCFYYSGKSASELQSIIKATDSAIIEIARAREGR